MNKKYKKQVRVAMAVTLAATSVVHSVESIFALNESTLIDIVEKPLENKENIQNVEKAVGDVTIDETNFPDSTFRSYISTNFDKNSDGILSSDEIANITSIYIGSNSNITSVQGIEHFPNLMSLTCFETGVTELDVSNNPELTELNCSYTGITELDLSNNTALEELLCAYTGITKLDLSKNTALTYLTCFGSGITGLDVSKNTALTYLSCWSTGITELDVSKNTALTSLNCGYTGITELDVSQNTSLSTLYCSNTGIKELDVSQNTSLSTLYCENTGITELDVSKNTALRRLYANDNNLAWLNIGDKPNLYDIFVGISDIDLGEVEDTFNITEVFPGIDIDKIIITGGASLDKDTGVVNGYVNGTPITYTYDCGTRANGNAVTLDVTLHFNKKKQASSIIINDDLNKVYDGQAVAEPQVTVIGSTGAVIFEWYTEDGQLLTSAPIEVGSYKLVVTVIEDANYNGVTTEIAFSIKEAQLDTLPVTGDSTQAGLWTMLVGLSTGLMMYFRKKNRKEEV